MTVLGQTHVLNRLALQRLPDLATEGGLGGGYPSRSGLGIQVEASVQPAP